MKRLLSTVFWLALLASGTAGVFVAAVPPGHQGQRDREVLGPGLHLHVPVLWPLRTAPAAGPATDTPPPASPAAITEQVERLRTTAGRLRTEIEAERGREAEAAAARQRAAAELDAALERSRTALAATAHEEVTRLLAEAEVEAVALLGEARARAARDLAEAELALARAEADRDRQLAALLATPGGRYHIALEAVARFTVPPGGGEPGVELPRKLGSLAAWRRYFLED